MPKTTNTTTTSDTSARRFRGGRPRTMRARQSYRTGSFEVFTYPHHSVPAQILGMAWRWRVELLTLTTLATVWIVLVYQLPQDWPSWSAPVVLATTITVICLAPVSGRFITRRVWCVFSRHRTRKCFVQSRVMTHEGLLPLFIWTRPTPVGERLLLWLRPGLSGRDIEAVTDRIAAACWARTARVTVSPTRAAVCWVEVIRRDPLATDNEIDSLLLTGVHPDHFEGDADVIPLPDRSTLTPGRPVQATTAGETPMPVDPAPAARGATKRTGTRTPTPATDTSAAVVVGWSGEDVSDYV